MSDDRSNVIARAVLEQVGNLCAFPGCGQHQYLEITHILSRQPGGPRYDPGEPVGTGTANVIVLCPTHHHLVDAEPHRFSAVVLRKMRDAQLERARRRADADHGMGSQQQGLGSRPSDLAEALRIWDEHAAPQPEEYWHHLFEEIPELLVAAVPGDAVQLGSKCYVGGKSLDNRHGNIVDFIYTTRSTSNATLVEIKTPEAKLVGGAYRDVFMPSAELSGSVMQAFGYRDALLKNYYALANDPDSPRFRVFNPGVLVIIGNLERERPDERQRRSFDLFRYGLHGVVVVTFDELFAKVRDLVALIQQGQGAGSQQN